MMQQYPLIPPSLRGNIDYILISKESCIVNKKRIYNNYKNIFTTFELFCEIIDKYTKDNKYIIIDNNSRSSNIADKFFWFEI